MRAASAATPGCALADQGGHLRCMLLAYERTLAWALRRAADDADPAGHDGAERVSLQGHPQGLLPAAGHRPPGRRHPGDQAISFQAMRTKLNEFIDIVKADPAVSDVVAFTGGQRRNGGFML
jgi:multidrug efflux pump